ncbi:MAG: hypothetical protein A4E24_01540 [Methanomethylovorans sp. PtaU1.Bin093]|uniref:hypothetical protein n=1 Tax=Methanomethylovorans sp. PtaU1.Bin093 TaxID=1811679 RepID=UPI0009D56D25|nr:hypothetical protein [Methanomethylovorans sp. PtaU1.Bin093]OPY19728.1 MAG: hypothetical protein A4E24_01540 [Methanomethylovorans sp. PtaU1.Bin093]
MTTPMAKISQQTRMIESAKKELISVKGVCRVISLDTADLENIRKLEILDEQNGCRVIGRKHNAGIRRALCSDVVLSLMVNKEYDWPINTIKLYHKGKMIGEDIQDHNTINDFSEHADPFIMGNIVFYDKESVRNSNIDDPICMFITAQPCPRLDALGGISDAVMAIPSRYTHEYLQLKICGDQKQMLGSFLVGFNIDKRASAPFSIDDDQISMSIKDRKCQLPL